MASFQEYKRRSIIPLCLLGLAAYYVFVVVPLDRRVRNLDTPLQQAWQKLAGSLDQTNATALDFSYITNQLQETRQSLIILQEAKEQAAARIDLSPALRARVNAPFQLVDYQNQRSKQRDELAVLAKKNRITVDPAVYAGFPEHTVDIRQPALLWPALAMVDALFATAIQCKVSAFHALDVAVPLTNAPSAATGRLAEIPIQIEFTGPSASVSSFLRSLPLRAGEMQAAGLPEAPADKPALFVDQLVIRKQSPDKVDEVRVSLRAIGFVHRE
jgi:hypothetical protein